MYVVAVQDFNEHATKKRPLSGLHSRDKRQRVSSSAVEGEEEDEVEEDEMKSAHTAFKLRRAKVRCASEIGTLSGGNSGCETCMRRLLLHKDQYGS